MLNFFYFFLSFFVFVSFVSIIYWTIKNGISPMPTSPKVKKALLQTVDESIPKDLIGDVFELGSGFLTLGVPLARIFPNNQIIALEISTIPFIYSKIIIYFLKYKNLDVRNEDFFKVNLNQASLVVCYLYPKAMEKLKSKFEDELQDGTYIISNTFAIPGWTPIKIVVVEDLYRTNIYLYRYSKG